MATPSVPSVPGFFTPDEERQIQQEMLGKTPELELLNSSENVEKINLHLADSSSSFSELSKRIDRIVQKHLDQFSPEERSRKKEELDNRVKLIITRALTNARKTVDNKIQDIKRAYEKRLKDAKEDPAIFTLAERSVDNRLKGKAKEKAILVKRDELVKEKITEEMKEELERQDLLEHLLKFVDTPEDFLKVFEEGEPERKEEVIEAQRVKAEEEARGKKILEDAAEKDKKFREAPVGKKVKALDKVENIQDVMEAADKWDAVLNALGDKPSKGDVDAGNLYWPALDGAGQGQKLNDFEKQAYKNFETDFNVELIIVKGTIQAAYEEHLADMMDILEAPDAIIAEALKQIAEKIFEDLTDGKTLIQQGAFLYYLSAKNKGEAIKKLIGNLHNVYASPGAKAAILQRKGQFIAQAEGVAKEREKRIAEEDAFKKTPEGTPAIAIEQAGGIEELLIIMDKWDAVVNVLGNKPDVNDIANAELYWPAENGKRAKKLSPEDLDNYKTFKESRKKYAGLIKGSWVANMKREYPAIDPEKDDQKTIDAKLEKAAKRVFDAMLLTYKEPWEQGLLCYCLEARDKKMLYQRILEKLKELQIKRKGDAEKAKVEAEKIAKEAEEAAKKAGVEAQAKEAARVKRITDIKSVADFEEHMSRWVNVINDLGEKPDEGDVENGNLYFKGETDEVLGNKLNGEQAEAYKEFLGFGSLMKEMLDGIHKEITKHLPTLKGKSVEQLDEEVAKAAKIILKDVSPAADNHADALALFTLGVTNKRQAYEKIQNLIKLSLISEARTNRSIYEVETDEEGNEKSIKLEEFMRIHHQKYAAEMVNKALGVMKALHAMNREKIENMDQFHEALIQIIKTKGGVETLNFPQAEAKRIYTAFLTIKDPKIGEKEILSLLIAFQKQPPEVYEIVNDKTIGWVIAEDSDGKPIRKTGRSVVEDLTIDGGVYAEVERKLKLGRLEFVPFIKRIAPVYEKVRSLLEENPAMTEAELNTAIAQVITNANKRPTLLPGDVEKFKKMIDIKLGVDKVGHAYKYATYLDKMGGIAVPIMREVQGEDYVENVAWIKTPDHIKKMVQKWARVVNDLGEKPDDNDIAAGNLYWPDKEKKNPVGKKLLKKDVELFKEFKEYMGKKKGMLENLHRMVTEDPIDLQNLNAQQIEEAVSKKAKSILSLMEPYSSNNFEALFYYVLNCANKADAYQKLKNIIKLSFISRQRKGKAVYEIETDAEGKGQTVKLDQFLARHHEFGGIMVTKTLELSDELHRIYGSLNMSRDEFRDALIHIISTKGGAEIPGKVSADVAKQIYTSFLILKHPNIGEKEMLALLLAFKKKPPYVYDIVNTTVGWQLATKKENHEGSIEEDLKIDEGFYYELQETLFPNDKGGMLAFNKFIIKVAPYFEKIRSLIESKKLKSEPVTADYINEQLSHLEGDLKPGPEHKLDDADLQNFLKMMKIELWGDKVGNAYKHAKFLNDDIEVPKMREIQGPDTVKNIDVVFVNVEEKMNRIARRLADERLDQEMKELGPQLRKHWYEIFRADKMLFKWWKRNALEGYRDKYTAEILARLKTDRNYRMELMGLNRNEVKPGTTLDKLSGDTPAPGTEAALSDELDRIAERFGIAWAEPTMRDDMLTENETIRTIQNEKVQGLIKDLCRDYVNNRAMTDAEFRERVRTQILPEIQAMEQTPDNMDPAIATFLEENNSTLAPEARRGLLDKLKAHRAGLIALDLDNMNIRLAIGRARNVDVKTQVKDVGVADKFARWMVEGLQRNKYLGRFVNPATVGVLAFGLSNVISQAMASKYSRMALGGAVGLVSLPWAPAAVGIGIGAALGGAFAFFRENKEQLHLKAQKERRMALGQRPLGYRPPNDQRGSWGRYEDKLENGTQKLYPKESVVDLYDDINAATNYNDLIQAIAHASALNDISEMGITDEDASTEQGKIDLISFPGQGFIESHRLALVKSIAVGKRRLATMPGAGANPMADLDARITTERTNIVNAIQLSESNFRSFKFKENLKSAGIGMAFGAAIASIGLLFPKEVQTPHRVNMTPAGDLKPNDFDVALKAAGYTPTQITDIHSKISFDASGNITQASKDAISKAYNLDLSGKEVAGAIIKNYTHLGGATAGMKMNQVDFMYELQRHGIDTQHGQVQFDAAGHLTPASEAYLKANHVQWNEVLSTTSGGGAGTPGKFGPGWSTLKTLNFNDNQPHAPNAHRLDELHFWWDGKPEIRPDGNAHFTIKGMFDPKAGHSFLPSGVTMPADASALKVGLQVKGSDGHNYWKFFVPGSDGSVKIPSDYFDKTVGAIARGGDTLPGLKTNALAVGFIDNHGAYQVLASAKGAANFVPEPKGEWMFTGDIVDELKKDPVQTFSAFKDTVVTDTRYWVAPGIVGTPMQHLEYGPQNMQNQGAVPNAGIRTPGSIRTARQNAPAGGPGQAPTGPQQGGAQGGPGQPAGAPTGGPNQNPQGAPGQQIHTQPNGAPPPPPGFTPQPPRRPVPPPPPGSQQQPPGPGANQVPPPPPQAQPQQATAQTVTPPNAQPAAAPQAGQPAAPQAAVQGAQNQPQPQQQPAPAPQQQPPAPQAAPQQPPAAPRRVRRLPPAQGGGGQGQPGGQGGTP